MRKIEIFDTTLRDGEQSAGVNLHGDEKVEIARQLERWGVDVIEAGFAASSRGEMQALRGAQSPRLMRGRSPTCRADAIAAYEVKA